MLSHIRTQITDSFILALKSVAPESTATPVLERPKQAAHGDAACNIAMQLAKPLGKNPRELAQNIIDAMPANSLIAALEIAGSRLYQYSSDRCRQTIGGASGH
jgi:arginyl-tRNA synthetase